MRHMKFRYKRKTLWRKGHCINKVTLTYFISVNKLILKLRHIIKCLLEKRTQVNKNNCCPLKEKLYFFPWSLCFYYRVSLFPRWLKTIIILSLKFYIKLIFIYWTLESSPVLYSKQIFHRAYIFYIFVLLQYNCACLFLPQG